MAYYKPLYNWLVSIIPYITQATRGEMTEHCSTASTAQLIPPEEKTHPPRRHRSTCEHSTPHELWQTAPGLVGYVGWF